MEKTAQSVFYKIAFSILIVVIGFFLAQYIIKLNEIQKEIAKLQIEVGKIQIQIIDRQEIKEMIIDYHINHACSKGKETE